VTWVLGIASVALCLLFAVTSPSPAPPTSRDLSPSDAPPRQHKDSLPFDLEAFASARIWIDPPSVAEVEQEPTASEPPPPVVRLELLAIVTDIDAVSGESVRLAAIYEPAEDRVLLVRPGERIGRHKIADVGETRVVVVTGSRRTILELSAADAASHGDRS